MATIINNPSSEGGDSAGVIVAVVLLIVLGGLFFVYGLPMLRNNPQADNQNTVQIPDKIDINVEAPSYGNQ